MSFYRTIDMGDGVYRITSAEAVCMELLVGEDRALLFDTGWGLGNLKETVRQITDKPLIVVNSHGHVDHVNGNSQFESDIYIHPDDIELCRMHSSAEMRKFILGSCEGMGILPEGFDRDKYLSPKPQNYIPVKEGDIFDLGGKTLQAVELPGHTPGSIGLLYREKGILYPGDALVRTLIMYGPESAKLSVYMKTLDKADALEFTEMFQSHRQEAAEKEELKLYRAAAERAGWDTAIPYRDPGKKDAEPNPDVRVVCTEGKTLDDLEDPDFACIIISKEKF